MANGAIMTSYLCTVDAEVVHADSEADALEAMMERLKLGAVVVNVVEIEGEKCTK